MQNEPTINSISIETIIQTSLSMMEVRGYKKETLDNYRFTYRKFQRYCMSEGIFYYTKDAGKQFMEYLRFQNPPLCSEVLRNYKGNISKLDCIFTNIEWKPFRRPKGDYAKSCYNDVITAYDEYSQRTGKSENRVHKLVLMAAEFLQMIESLGCLQLESITAKMILSCFEQTTDKRNFRDTVGTFLQYAYNRKMIKINLRHLIPKMVKRHCVPSVYSPEEVERLLDSINRTTEIGKRNYAIILIAARLGLRASDIANLRLENLKSENIEIIQYKTKQPLKTPLLDEVREAIFDYVDNGRPPSTDTRIFLNEYGYGAIKAKNISNITVRVFGNSPLDCNTRKRGPHSLRASLATALLSEGNDYPTIQKVLGQTNIQSTKHYAKSDVEQLRKCAVAVPPLSGNLAEILAGGGCI